MLNKTYLIICIFYLYSCVQINKKLEDPIEVAKNYCTCLNNEIRNSKDSLIDVNDCDDKELSRSRLMEITYSGDLNKYSIATLESAFNFTILVRNITDTMCINKLDP